MNQAERIDLAELSEKGAAALQAGDPESARRHFEKIAAAGQAGAYHWVCLALACKALHDEAGLLAASDNALQSDPRNLSALILKGDYLVAKRNVRAATQYYGAAVAIAARMRELPAAMASEVRRAAEARDRINTHIAQHLEASLAQNGFDRRTASSRFTQSLDILTGRKQPYFQQPRAYLFPELPQVQFYGREAFPWLDDLEASTEAIRDELVGVMRDQQASFVPYIQTDPSAPARGDHDLLDSLDWSAFYLWKDGKPVPDNAARCPRTLAALERAPLARIKERTPSILFSALKPGARIAPHHGFLNTRLICHLPLIVPAGCGFRVGNEVREWQAGEAWVFDDTIEHEAWNSGTETRVILIFDIWRPELTEEERGLIAALMEAVDAYPGGAPVSWDA